MARYREMQDILRRFGLFRTSCSVLPALVTADRFRVVPEPSNADGSQDSHKS